MEWRFDKRNIIFSYNVSIASCILSVVHKKLSSSLYVTSSSHRNCIKQKVAKTSGHQLVKFANHVPELPSDSHFKKYLIKKRTRSDHNQKKIDLAGNSYTVWYFSSSQYTWFFSWIAESSKHLQVAAITLLSYTPWALSASSIVTKINVLYWNPINSISVNAGVAKQFIAACGYALVVAFSWAP